MRTALKPAAILLAVIILLSSLPLSAGAEENGDYKLLALTFDDGPGEFTGQLLNALAERSVKATFFVVGTNASRYPELLERMVKEGHQLGNHTQDHKTLTELSADSIKNEVAVCRTKLAAAGGENTVYDVRPPYGSVNGKVKKNIEAPIVMWSVDPLDWKYRDAEKVVENIMVAVSDGDIILLHDIHETSVEAAIIAIDRLQAEGYEFVTVSELLRRRGIEAENGAVYFYARNNGVNLPPEPNPEAYDESRLSEHYAYSAICFTRSAGIFSGGEGDAFYPNRYLTRGMFAAALGRLAKVDTADYPSDGFDDVADGAYYAPYVAWAADKSIMTGYGGGRFGPNDKITREQLAVSLSRYLVYKGCAAPEDAESVDYTDAGRISPWAAVGVDLSTRCGLLSGGDDGAFRPRDKATRGQCAVILERLYRFADAEGYEAVVAAMNAETEAEEEKLREQEAKESFESKGGSMIPGGVTAAAGVLTAAALFAGKRRK